MFEETLVNSKSICQFIFLHFEPKRMWEMLQDYLEAESDCSERNSNYNESVSNNISLSEENTNDIISISTYSDDLLSSQLRWKFPNTFAAKTLPDGLSLRCSNLPNAVYGVYATREIKTDTIFGPYVGTRNFDEQFFNNCGRFWKIFMNNKFHHYIDGQDPETSNWMTYINYAGRSELQNLESFQYGYQIYYRATVDILEDAELLVWYAADYNQDCLSAGGKLKKLITDKTSAAPLGSQCQTLEHKTSNDNVPIVVTSSISCDKNNYDVEGVTKKAHTKMCTDGKQYNCDACNATFSKSSSLRRHKRIHTVGKPYKCDVCDAAFTRNYHLRRHKRTHTGEKPYKCDVCDAAFARSGKRSLRRHKRIHTGEKPYKCDVCDAAFTRKYHLRTHKRTHTGEKPYKCDVCDAAYARSDSLKAHKRTYPGERPCKCNVCNAAFADQCGLRRHRRIHTGEKPYKCDVCDAAFARDYHLRTHKRTHTGEKPYKTDVFDAVFPHNISSNLHKMTRTET